MEILKEETYRSKPLVNMTDNMVRVTLTMTRNEWYSAKKKLKSKKPSSGFSYVNIVSSSKECDGWLNLFFGEYCIALVRDVEFADMLRKDLPEKAKDL